MSDLVGTQYVGFLTHRLICIYRVGGLVQHMVWDRSGERLAVMFKGTVGGIG